MSVIPNGVRWLDDWRREAAFGFANFYARLVVKNIRKELGLDTESEEERPASTPAEVPGC